MKFHRILNLFAVTQAPNPGFTTYKKPYFLMRSADEPVTLVCEDPTMDPHVRGWIEADGTVTPKGYAEIPVVRL